MKISILPLGTMRTNCLVISDEATGIGAVIDPGGEGCTDSILNRLESEGVKLKYIILTHAHFDHLLSLRELRQRTGAPLALHKYDAESLFDPSLTYMEQFAGITEGEAPAEILLDDGDIIELGDTKLLVMHLPGHTQGSIALITDGIIIAGDVLFRGSIGRCDLYGGDEMAMNDSLKRLCSLGGDYKIYPGHGSTTTLQRERTQNIYLQRIL